MLNFSTIQQDATVAPAEVRQLSHAVKALPEHSPLRDFISEVLEALSQGSSILLVKQDKELTPNDVASILQVSRPHVMKMINAGILSAHVVGKHYRIKHGDLLDFIDRRDRASKHVAEVISASGTHKVSALDSEAMDNLRQL